MQIGILRSFAGQAITSGIFETTTGNIQTFAAELSRYLSRGYEIDLSFNGKEINLNKPMSAQEIISILN